MHSITGVLGHRAAHAVIAATLVFTMAACPGARPAETPQAQDTATERIMAWASSRVHRGPRPKSSTVRLLTLPAGQPIERGIARGPCMRAATFLPGPTRDPRVFLLIDGQLVARDPQASDRLVELAMPSRVPALRIERLLAFSRSGDPVELLVATRAKRGAPASLWVLGIGRDAIAYARPAKLSALSNRRAFFERFDAPRCKRGDRRCLYVARLDGQTLLYEEPVAGQSRRELQSLGTIEVREAAWAPGARVDKSDSTLYLLTACTAKVR